MLNLNRSLFYNNLSNLKEGNIFNKQKMLVQLYDFFEKVASTEIANFFHGVHGMLV
jgi:hypothetical protein